MVDVTMKPCTARCLSCSNTAVRRGKCVLENLRTCVSRAVPDPATPPPEMAPSANYTKHMLASASSSIKTETLQRPQRDLVTRIQEIPTGTLVAGLVCAQAVTLIGSLVGGHLARKRRIEVEQLNSKLREVVGEMRKQQAENQANLVCSVDPDEALVAYQQALESSLAAPSAPHPVQDYGPEGYSLAEARRKVSTLLTDARKDLEQNQPFEAELKCTDALVRCKELGDERAVRATLKLMAKAQKELGNFAGSFKTLEKALEVSRKIGDQAGDVDILGMMADLQVTLGNLEEASKLYDEVIEAVRNESDAEPMTSWDC